MIDGRNFFDQSIRTNLRTYKNIRKITTGQGDGYAIGCPVHYPYFKERCKKIAIDLSKPEAFDANPKAIS